MHTYKPKKACSCGCQSSVRPPSFDCNKISLISSDNSVEIQKTSDCTFDITISNEPPPFLLNKQNSETISFTGTGNFSPLIANVNISPVGGNILVADGTGLYVPTPTPVNLIGGSNINIVGTFPNFTINATTSGEVNTAANVGATGVGLFRDKTGVTINMKKLRQGVNIILTDEGDTVLIDSVGGGGGGGSFFGNQFS